MEEIAASMAAVGLPPGFHEAAADIYGRAARAEGPAAYRAGSRNSGAAEPASTIDTIMSALM
jgi:hypothetical protein